MYGNPPPPHHKRVRLPATQVHVMEHNDQGALLGNASVCYAPITKPSQLLLVGTFACLRFSPLDDLAICKGSCIFEEQFCCVYTTMMALAQQSPVPFPCPHWPPPLDPSLLWHPPPSPHPQGQVSARHQVATMCDHEGMLLDDLSRVACIPGGVSNALHDTSLGITLECRASFKGPAF